MKLGIERRDSIVHEIRDNKQTLYFIYKMTSIIIFLVEMPNNRHVQGKCCMLVEMHVPCQTSEKLRDSTWCRNNTFVCEFIFCFCCTCYTVNTLASNIKGYFNIFIRLKKIHKVRLFQISPYLCLKFNWL